MERHGDQVHVRLSRPRTQLQSQPPWRSETARHASRRDPGARSKRRGSRAGARRGRGEQLERTQAQRIADAGWIEWGGELTWAVGFTSGGAPYGLRVCDFDRADLEAMGLDVPALEAAGQLATAETPAQESNGWLADDDVPF
jgi:hypothetical protein